MQGGLRRWLETVPTGPVAFARPRAIKAELRFTHRVVTGLELSAVRDTVTACGGH